MTVSDPPSSSLDGTATIGRMVASDEEGTAGPMDELKAAMTLDEDQDLLDGVDRLLREADEALEDIRRTRIRSSNSADHSCRAEGTPVDDTDLALSFDDKTADFARDHLEHSRRDLYGILETAKGKRRDTGDCTDKSRLSCVDWSPARDKMAYTRTMEDTATVSEVVRQLADLDRIARVTEDLKHKLNV
ncbi:hypothetical protein FOZ60_001526 [Perkinsus olseni]|uniref:Uncharacterized protein n=1 Tax=Perkinsus olseni TaxID=32597 RepID=A0A7J6P0F3_PEROL|nr:hypothetical protein FOZ60_001526 [Perkinsus olseni]